MRIKEVCKETGLTDKAVRLYINNQLINPCFTENYAGRKNYSFNDEDVEALKRIAILRKYNFSLNDIKEMLENSQSIALILEKHLNNTKQNLEESSMVLTNLNNAYNSTVDSVDDLCNILSENLEPNHYDILNAIHTIWNKIKKKIPMMIGVCIIGIVIAIILLVVITILLSKLFMLLS
ncbi:MAG: MerR family transcriptional regulator [Clostridium sp.]|nr:MerR family transcriptional regulator [Clostridium sp.]